MNYTADILIKGESAKLFEKIKKDFEFIYFDIYMYSALVGLKTLVEKKTLNIPQDTDDPTITIPRNVIVNRGSIVELVTSVIAYRSLQDSDFNEKLKLTFEDNGTDAKQLYRMQITHQCAMVGIRELHNKLYGKKEVTTIEDLEHYLTDYFKSINTKSE